MKGTNLLWSSIQIAVRFPTQLKNSCAIKKLRCPGQSLFPTIWLIDNNHSLRRSNFITRSAQRTTISELTLGSTRLRSQTLQKTWTRGKVPACWLAGIAYLMIRSKCLWHRIIQRTILFSLYQFPKGFLTAPLLTLRGLSLLRGMELAFMIWRSCQMIFSNHNSNGLVQ